jgi:hypothetical protein
VTLDVQDNETDRKGTLDGMYWASGMAEIIWEGDTTPFAVRIGSFHSIEEAPC